MLPFPYLQTTDTAMVAMATPMTSLLQKSGRPPGPKTEGNRFWRTAAPPRLNCGIDQTRLAITVAANQAQARLMALRGAELDARRKLAEKINGLMITSNTSVHDFVATNDQIRTSMLTFQQGGHVIEGSQKVLEDGTAQATVEIDPRPLWNMILYYQRTLSIRIR